MDKGNCNEMTARALMCWGGLSSRMGEEWPHIFKGNQTEVLSVMRVLYARALHRKVSPHTRSLYLPRDCIPIPPSVS